MGNSNAQKDNKKNEDAGVDKENEEGEEARKLMQSDENKGDDVRKNATKANGKQNGGNNDVTDSGKDKELRRRKRKPSEESEVSLESLEEYIPTPPDGGWGWVVVLASMLGNCIVDGIGYGFGVFLMPLVKAFNAPKSQVSLAGSLLPGTYLFAGAVVSAMTNKFGCRPVVIAGSLVSTVAFLLASRATSIVMLILTYGVMGGFGLGMMYLPCIVIVGYYFERRRGLANGLAVSGSGMGTFAFSPLAEFLLSEYSWHGALLIIAGLIFNLLIIAGLIFNGCICGFLMRPLVVKSRPKSNGKSPREKNLLDRLKESTQMKNRSVSECSPGKAADANHTIQERVLEAKLRREKKLQDTDSDLGSLPSVAFVKSRLDSMSEHRRFSESQKQKLSISSANDSASSPTREVTPAVEVTSGSGDPGTPTITIETEGSKVKDEGGQGHEGITPDPDSEAKVSIEADPSSVANDDTSTERSDYYTPPISPASTNQNSPQKEVSGSQLGNGSVMKRADSSKTDDSSEKQKQQSPGQRNNTNTNSSSSNNINGIIRSTPSIPTTTTTTPSPSLSPTSGGSHHHHPPGSEVSPLLEVPDPSIAIGHKKGGGDYRRQASVSSGAGHVGSRTSMSHLSSMRSLHVSKKDLARPLYRKDIFYSGSVLNIPQYHSQADMKSYITSITTIPGASELVDVPSGSSRFVNKCCSCLPRSARDVLGEMVDVSLLKDMSFMLICVGNILTFLGFFIPFMFLVDRATEMGVGQKDAAFLVSIIGITNTIGRVAIGKVADLKVVNSLVMTYLSILLCAASTALVPFCNSYILLALVAALFGLGVAGFVSLSSIIICDRMGLEKLTNGFGLLCMVRGVGTMMGPPLAGAMYDSSGSYDLSFFLGGLLMFAGAGCHVLLHLPCLSRPGPVEEGEFVLETVEEITDGEGQQLADMMSSKPQIVTLEDALSAV